MRAALPLARFYRTPKKIELGETVTHFTSLPLSLPRILKKSFASPINFPNELLSQIISTKAKSAKPGAATRQCGRTAAGVRNTRSAVFAGTGPCRNDRDVSAIPERCYPRSRPSSSLLSLLSDRRI